MNVFVILEDALRPDHMGCYGYAKNTTPHCDRLVREGVRFDNAIAVSTHTVPSIVSMLTGLSTVAAECMSAKDYEFWKHHDAWRGRRTPLHDLREPGRLRDPRRVGGRRRR